MAGLNQGLFFVGCQTCGRDSVSFITTASERGQREGGNKNPYGTCGDVRALCKAGRLKEALHILTQPGIQADSYSYVCLLQECINIKDLAYGREVHAQIIQSGLKANIFIFNTLINMYAKCGSVVNARKVFDKMPERDVFTWNTMLAGYTKLGYGREAFKIYELMIQEGVKPDKVTFVCIINACASIGDLKKGKDVHADIIKAGIVPYIILENTLVDMYAKCGSFKDALQVFKKMATRNVVSWNAMITGYAQHGCGSEALEIYEQMIREGVTPNKVTFVCVLNACASVRALKKGKEVHAAIIKAGTVPYIKLENSLVDMYAKCGCMKDARQVFDNMAERNVVSCNALITGYCQHGCGMEAFDIFKEMQREGVIPDRVTFICILNACASLASLEKGKEVHSDIINSGIEPNIIMNNTLVDMYAKCGSVKDAREVLDKMAERDVVSWNAMIAGYAQHGHGIEAFEIYKQLPREGVLPDMVTYICVLNACASLGTLEKGKEVHADVIQARITSCINLENSLLDMYAKCGSVNNSRQVFNSMVERNVVSWSAMIGGCAQHGCGREALQLFEEMQQEGLTPNSTTFTSVLSACSHVGLVDEGLYYFYSMRRDHGLNPTLEHFGCMVDLLGRAGRLHEAENFIDIMPIEPDSRVWGALLGACRIYGDMEIGERAAKCLLNWDPQNDGNLCATLEHLCFSWQMV